MAVLRTAVLDDVNRKRGDLDPITATLRVNGAVENLTGATITVTITDTITQIPIVFDGACVVVAPLLGTVSFTPTALQMDVEGTFDVEFKKTTAGVPAHYPSSSYATLRIWAVLGYPALVPPVNPGSHTVPLSMLAQQTPGSVLLYDASGNAIAYAPSATPYSVLMNNGTGLPPTWQGAPGAAGTQWTSNGAALPPTWQGPRYLGQCSTRTYFPGSSGGGALLNMMSKSRHQVLDDVSSIQFCIANTNASISTTNSETGPGGALTATATVEFETGRRWRLTLAGNPSMVVPNGGWIWTDPLPWIPPKFSWFNFYMYQVNASGCVFSPGPQDAPLGELLEYNVGVDKTASGAIGGADTTTWAGPCGIRGLMLRPSVAIVGGADSISLGEGDTSNGAGARGGIVRALQQLGIPWQNCAIGATGPNNFLSGSHALRIELASLCSYAILSGGTNDLALGDAQMRADQLAIAALLPAAQRKYLATITPRTTGSWGDLAGQTLTAFQGVIDSHNAWRRTVPAGFVGCFDITTPVQSGATGKWLFPGYTADGLHPSAIGHAAIRDGGGFSAGNFTT